MASVKEFSKKIYGGDNIVNLSDIRYLPRWVILFLDIFLLFISVAISCYVTDSLLIEGGSYLGIWQKFLFIIGVNVVFMFVFKTYAGIIRHSTFIDLFKLLLASFFTVIVLGTVNILFYNFRNVELFHAQILFIYFSISFILLFVFRLLVKEFFHFVREFRRSTKRRRILVLGISDQSIAIARVVMDRTDLPYQLVGFLTQRQDSKKVRILGRQIITKEKLQQSNPEKLGIDGVLIIKELLTRQEVNEWVSLFLEKDLQVLKVPLVQKVRESDLGNSIKNLQIEDLLNRRPIKIENEEVRSQHFGKNVLVTGGAGSIGSEIVRQICDFQPETVVVLDQAETPLYEIEIELRNNFPNQKFKFVILDVSNYNRLENLFQKYRFAMVYHAAAYKHVPLMEENPHEAVFTNVQGSKNLAYLSHKYAVDRFVMVSTDKAVNPTNVMGATKRTAELYVQSLQNIESNTTRFITTRFGNVLGSNGSVIPLFKKQIEAGGPITITHPDIVRYFMTIPEACELVLQAGTMGKGGEVFVFDMGNPVKILDLAKRMIKLSGFEPDNDIKIIFTGLRPGEKLYEELLTDDAKTQPTPHEKIMVSKDVGMQYPMIDELVGQLLDKAQYPDKNEVVRILKVIVPEFKSNNSVYEMLD